MAVERDEAGERDHTIAACSRGGEREEGGLGLV